MKKPAFGGVLVDREGRVLLVRPGESYAGYAWTFPKGIVSGSETPEATALRRVREETGREAEIVARLAGEYEGSETRSGYFLMRPREPLGHVSRETERLRWAEFEEAERLIQETSYSKGRTRDRAVLSAARETLTRLELERCRAHLMGLGFDEPLFHHNLTVFPILGHENGGPPYDLLRTAIEKGTAVVEEVHEAGEVGTLKVVNRGDRPVLIVEGEILIGAKQNRVVNMTVLVGAGREYRLPVSCVEQGRWRHTSRHFTPAACMAPPVMRAYKTRSVRESLRMRGEAAADQIRVWCEAAAVLDDVGAVSPTGSVTEGYAARRKERQHYREHITLPPETRGCVVVRGEEVLGLDLFGDPGVMREFWPKLSEAYFLEATRQPKEQPPCNRERAQAFMDRVCEGLRPAGRQIGLGTTLEVGDGGTAGFVLWYADAVCHLAAFAVDEGEEGRPPRFDPGIVS
ncbi:NUDIX domain-containing protein [bacterium]|nr:NUDIX domain-containing protein [bacterium]